MADTYWLSFRIEDEGRYKNTYSERYQALIKVVQKAVNGKWWYESTSFYVFSSHSTPDQLAAAVQGAIDQTADLVVFGKTDYKSARAVGAVADDDIFALIPFMKKV